MLTVARRGCARAASASTRRSSLAGFGPQRRISCRWPSRWREIAALLAASGLYVLSQRRRDATRAAVFLGVGWCLSGLLLMRAAAAVAPIYSGVGLARALPAAPTMRRSTASARMIRRCRFIGGAPSSWSPIAASSTMACGTTRAPRLPSVAEFLARWSGESDGLRGDGEADVRGSQGARRAHAGSRPRCEPGAGGAPMSWITWALILSGVGLNAAAQLLLKVATRPLAHFSEFEPADADAAAC